MKRYTWPATISLILLLGLVLIWKIGSVKSPEVPFLTEDETKNDLIKSFLDEQAYLQSRIVSLRKEIEESEKRISDRTTSVNFETLEVLKKAVGLSEISGAGLEIFLDDGFREEGLVQAADVRDIVNMLSSASADAIAVNNQRVIASSPIGSVGATLLVNNAHITPPFVIGVIGDQGAILQRLMDEDLLPGIHTKTADFGMTYRIRKREQMTIPIYNGDLKVDHLNLVNE